MGHFSHFVKSSERPYYIHMKKYLLYLLRWQLSTPILAVCLHFLAGLGELWATIVANLIGGCIFFFVDKWIFKSDKKAETE